MTNPTRRGASTVQRDTPRYSSSGTTVLEREKLPSAGRRTRSHGLRAIPSGVRRSLPRTSAGRLGSQQVVTIRGRRIPSARQSSHLVRRSLIPLVLLICGVALAMGLSGASTQQTFAVQQLKDSESHLKNQVETLNRDLNSVSSSSRIAARAGELGMVLPEQPGVLNVAENGEVTESREPGEGSRPIIDINGETRQPTREDSRASSDPESIAVLPRLEAVPPSQSELPRQEQGTGAADPMGNADQDPVAPPYQNRASHLPNRQEPAPAEHPQG